MRPTMPTVKPRGVGGGKRGVGGGGEAGGEAAELIVLLFANRPLKYNLSYCYTPDFPVLLFGLFLGPGGWTTTEVLTYGTVVHDRRKGMADLVGGSRLDNKKCYYLCLGYAYLNVSTFTSTC